MGTGHRIKSCIFHSKPNWWFLHKTPTVTNLYSHHPLSIPIKQNPAKQYFPLQNCLPTNCISQDADLQTAIKGRQSAITAMILIFCNKNGAAAIITKRLWHWHVYCNIPPPSYFDFAMNRILVESFLWLRSFSTGEWTHYGLRFQQFH